MKMKPQDKTRRVYSLPPMDASDEELDAFAEAMFEAIMGQPYKGPKGTRVSIRNGKEEGEK